MRTLDAGINEAELLTRRRQLDSEVHPLDLARRELLSSVSRDHKGNRPDETVTGEATRTKELSVKAGETQAATAVTSIYCESSNHTE